ncbi:MAG: RES family NAD+ phosphorylase [Desulfobacterales bacterium]|nr:RES family NAD+ phosphorylase [Desulfobacterales bacterium]
MKVFKSWQSYSRYVRALKHTYRYIHTPEVEVFLQTVLETAEERVESIPKDSVLWRAQLGHGWRFENEEVGEVPAPYEPERMCPRPGRATEGRANPKGIPYLYLASNRETALAEARPWMGSQVSVGQFKILRKLKVVNCTTERKGLIIYFKEPPPKKREEAVWTDIDKAFAKPVTPTDDAADYVPTQVLSEFLKANGYDGIGYRSSLGNGYNIALFDIHSAEIINCFLFGVSGINFDFSEIANPYYLTKHYKKKKGKGA